MHYDDHAIVFCHCFARYLLHEYCWTSSPLFLICLSYLPLSTPNVKHCLTASEDAPAAFNSLVASLLSFTVNARNTDYQQSIPLLLHGGDGGI